jgi:hypothetical protein
LAKLPKGTWENRLDSGTSAFGCQEEQLAPLNLPIQNSEHISLNLPAYPAWVFLKTD